jgi:hypothetical protein
VGAAGGETLALAGGLAGGLVAVAAVFAGVLRLTALTATTRLAGVFAGTGFADSVLLLAAAGTVALLRALITRLAGVFGAEWEDFLTFMAIVFR